MMRMTLGSSARRPRYPVAIIFQFLKCAMHRSTADRSEEIVSLFVLSPVDRSPPFGFLRGVIAWVPWYAGSSDSRGFSEKIFPVALGERFAVMH